jgi:hypothetical protein
MDDNDGQAALFHMPLASIWELDGFATILDNDEGIIPYRLARQYAFIEFMASAQTFLPDYARQALDLSMAAGTPIPIALTNRPAIVYNYDDTPYYYEFGVIMGDQLLNTITVYAHKMTDQLIAFVGAASYEEYDFRYKRYVGMYPSVYYADWDMSYSIPVYNEDYNRFEMQGVDDFCSPLSTNPLDILADKLSNIPQADKDLMNEDLLYAEPIETNDGEIMPPIMSLQGYEALCAIKYDSSMVKLNSRLAWLAEDTIGDGFYLSREQKDTIAAVLSNVQTYTYYLPEYEDCQLRFTRWKGYCGPAAMAWLYRGKWDSFGGAYLPLYGNGWYESENVKLYDYLGSYAYYSTSSAVCERYGEICNTASWVMMSMEYDNGLCGVWYEHCHYLFEGQALFEEGMREGLESATYNRDNHYTINFTIVPRLWIYNSHEPVVIEGSPQGEPHYWAAIGVTFNTGLLGVPKNRFFLVTDNGSLTQYHGYYPFWKAYNFWNLHYGWKQQNI